MLMNSKHFDFKSLLEISQMFYSNALNLCNGEFTPLGTATLP